MALVNKGTEEYQIVSKAVENMKTEELFVLNKIVCKEIDKRNRVKKYKFYVEDEVVFEFTKQWGKYAGNNKLIGQITKINSKKIHVNVDGVIWKVNPLSLNKYVKESAIKFNKNMNNEIEA